MRESTFTLVYWGFIPSFPTEGQLEFWGPEFSEPSEEIRRKCKFCTVLRPGTLTIDVKHVQFWRVLSTYPPWLTCFLKHLQTGIKITLKTVLFGWHVISFFGGPYQQFKKMWVFMGKLPSWVIDAMPCRISETGSAVWKNQCLAPGWMRYGNPKQFINPVQETSWKNPKMHTYMHEW